MKKIMFLSIILLTISLLNAQEIKKSKTKKSEKRETKKIEETQAVNNEINFKNEIGNSVLTITDEGNNKGSITLPPLSTIGNTTDKLYNMSGTLYFNGSALSYGGSASSLNDLSDAIYNGFSLFLGTGSGVNDDGTNNYNTSIGYNSMQTNVDGVQNTATGNNALFSNNNGNQNVSNGYGSMYLNNSGSKNVGIGCNTLFSNNAGNSNTAIGYDALHTNKAGSGGVAIGYESQKNANNSTTAHINYNTSVGYKSLLSSTNAANNTGNSNSAFGYESLYSNTTGSANTANGKNALYSNTNGDYNTAYGEYALYSNTDGYSNIAEGLHALYYNTTGNNNTAIGYYAGPIYSDLSNTTTIGNGASVSADNQVKIGNSSVTSIGGAVGWSVTSDIRYKRNIRENVHGLDFIMGLKPITYNLDVNAIANKLGEDIRFDKDGNRTKEQPSAEILASRSKKESIRQSGFSAQDVEALVKKIGYDFGGVDKPENDNGFYGLRYSEFVVPLVKAVQEQQAIIDELKNEVNELRNEITGRRIGKTN